MHPYRVKEYMWLLIVIMIVAVSVLSGCSSAPVNTTHKPNDQFCYTKKTVEIVNGETVSSKTTLDCNDDKVERVAVKRAGLATNCGVFSYHMNVGGYLAKKRGVSCQKPDGSWEIIDTDYR